MPAISDSDSDKEPDQERDGNFEFHTSNPPDSRAEVEKASPAANAMPVLHLVPTWHKVTDPSTAQEQPERRRLGDHREVIEVGNRQTNDFTESRIHSGQSVKTGPLYFRSRPPPLACMNMRERCGPQRVNKRSRLAPATHKGADR
jgi:hypothetical protein